MKITVKYKHAMYVPIMVDFIWLKISMFVSFHNIA